MTFGTTFIALPGWASMRKEEWLRINIEILVIAERRLRADAMLHRRLSESEHRVAPVVLHAPALAVLWDALGARIRERLPSDRAGRRYILRGRCTYL